MENDEPTPGKKPRFTKEERLARLVDDAVIISDRFAREPVLARTGKGHYKSAGVEGLKEDMAYLKSLQMDLSASAALVRSAAGHYVAGVMRDDELDAILSQVPGD